MTNNQRRAAALAQGLCDGELHADALTEADWHLLLLAAGLRDADSVPTLVGQRVLDCARRQVGYFVRHPSRDTPEQ